MRTLALMLLLVPACLAQTKPSPKPVQTKAAHTAASTEEQLKTYKSFLKKADAAIEELTEQHNRDLHALADALWANMQLKADNSYLQTDNKLMMQARDWYRDRAETMERAAIFLSSTVPSSVQGSFAPPALPQYIEHAPIQVPAPVHCFTYSMGNSSTTDCN